MPDDDFKFISEDDEKGQEKEVLHEESGKGVTNPYTGETIKVGQETKGNIQEGVFHNEETFHCIVDATGRIINKTPLPINATVIDPVIGFIPPEQHMICQKCLIETGSLKHLYEGVTGIRTEFGNGLCAECVPINERNIKLYKYTFGLIRRTIY